MQGDEGNESGTELERNMSTPMERSKGDALSWKLGENVIETRCTQRGEIIFQLKKDSSVKNLVYREIVVKPLGSVRALSQKAVVECKNLDEIETEEELRLAMIEQCNVDVPMQIRMRKAFEGTQTAAIRLPVDSAEQADGDRQDKSRLAQEERSITRRNYKNRDRSALCLKCDGNGLVARGCTKQPRFMVSEPEDGNDQATGVFKCASQPQSCSAR